MNNINEYKGDFKVTKDMVSNGMLIKELIPRKVTGHFYCSNLELTSLEGCPELVGESFMCSNNELTSLKGGPKYVNRSFYCRNNLLSSLVGSPESVGGSFWCHSNKLISLEGGPKIVSGTFDCRHNKLLSLDGGPEEVGEYFYCSNNKVDLKIEKDFIKSGQYKDNYYLGLLKYMISNNINLTEITSWPNVFIYSLEQKYRNLLLSVKGINKFKL